MRTGWICAERAERLSADSTERRTDRTADCAAQGRASHHIFTFTSHEYDGHKEEEEDLPAQATAAPATAPPRRPRRRLRGDPTLRRPRAPLHSSLLPPRFVDTRSPSSHSPHCGATSLGEFGDMMVSMLPKNLAFTVFVPSPESFRRVLKLQPNDSVAEGKASDTYAVVSRVLGFSAVPRRLRAVDVPLHERVRLLDSVSGLKIYALRDVDGALDVNGVWSECVDIIRDESIVHVMVGVLMDANFERSFSSDK